MYVDGCRGASACGRRSGNREDTGTGAAHLSKAPRPLAVPVVETHCRVQVKDSLHSIGTKRLTNWEDVNAKGAGGRDTEGWLGPGQLVFEE